MINKYQNKIKKIKKIFGISILATFGIGSGIGIGFSSVNIANSVNLSNDFSEGTSIQIQLSLVEKNKFDENLSPITDPIKQREYLDTSVSALAKHLQLIGLLNIKLSSGISYENVLNQKPIGIIIATFENSVSALQLKDIKEDVNTFYNENQIQASVGKTNRYELEAIKDTYLDKNTFRAKNPTLLYKPGNIDKPNDTDGSVIIPGIINYDINDPKNLKEKIGEYVNSKSETDSSLAQVISNEYYNNRVFIEEKNIFDSKKPVEPTTPPTSTRVDTETPDPETPEPETPPTDQDIYQTQNTWFLWNDKAGFINYLNKLLLAAYYNAYANRVFPKVPGFQAPWINGYDDINLKVGSTDEFIGPNQNYVDVNIRNQINEYLNNSLSDVEKKFIKFVVVEGLTNEITNETLFPTIYNFYNAKLANGDYLVSQERGKEGYISNSEKAGWGWLESKNNDLSDFFGEYLVSKIDYRNYDTFFKDQNPPEVDPDAPEQKPDDPLFVFNTDKFLLNSNIESIPDLITRMNERRFALPIQNNFLNLQLGNLIKTFQTTDFSKENFKLPPDKKPEGMSDEEYETLKTQFNDKVTGLSGKFDSKSLFWNQNLSKPRLDNSITTLSPFISMIIILSAFIFIIGIFISIRYKFPGFLAFLSSSLTFVLSFLLFNYFGFTFSFISYIGLVIATFLSFITPFHFFKNLRKEMSEGSSIYGGVVKTIKKYWKMSLDTHIAAIIAALSFLFFGKLQNIDFGAMLIISCFLSMLLSGVIFYILILFFLTILGLDNYYFFLTKKEWNKLTSLNNNFNNKNKESKFRNIFINPFTTNINFFNKKMNLSIFIIIPMVILGVVILGVFGPSVSNDFSGSYIITINNFDTYNISANDFYTWFGSNAILGQYVFDNQLVMTFFDNVTFDTIKEILINNKVEPEIISQLLNNISVTESSSIISIETVYNTLSCIGISIGFMTFWSLISLNIVAILPIVISQAFTILLIASLVGLFQIPFDLNGLIIIIALFIMTTIINFGVMSSIKSSWDRSQVIKKYDLKLLINSIVSKINNNYLSIMALVILFSIFSIVIGSLSLLFVFFLLIVGIAVLYFTNNRIMIYVWLSLILLRDKYKKEIIKNDEIHKIKKFEYDDYNEQKIKGLNF